MNEFSFDNLIPYIEFVHAKHGKMYFFKRDAILGQSLRQYGEWAENEIEFISDLVQEGDVVIDAGAFIGTHTLAFSKKVGKVGEVIGFEPHQMYYSILKENISQNGINNVTLFNSALGKSSEPIYLPNPSMTEQSNYGGLSAINVGSSKNKANVECKYLDELALKQCNLIKADVEGMEIELLYGAVNTIANCRPYLYLECNSVEFGIPIVEFLRLQNYDVFAHCILAFNHNNFKGKKENIFGNAREIMIFGVPKERVNDIFLERFKRNDLIEIRSFDDLVLAFLRKPQYQEEILNKLEKISDWGKYFWERGKEPHLDARLDTTQAALETTQQLAIERANQINELSARLDTTQAALETTQQLAIDRANQINELSARLDTTQTLLSRYENSIFLRILVSLRNIYSK